MKDKSCVIIPAIYESIKFLAKPFARIIESKLILTDRELSYKDIWKDIFYVAIKYFRINKLVEEIGL